MIVLKILFWIIVISLAIFLLVGLIVLLALSTKIQIGFDYDKDGVRLKLKYGFIPIKVYPELFAPEKREKLEKKFAKLKYKFGPKAEKLMGKVQNKVDVAKEKNDVKSDLKKIEDIQQTDERIAKKQIELDAKIAEANAEYENAVQSEAAGTPLPDVVNEDEVSKIQKIKDGLETVDFEETYSGIKEFLSGFSFDSIVALLSYIGKQTGNTFGKVLKRIIIKRFCVGLTVSGDDAAKTAIKYGTISSIAFPAMGKMVTSLKVGEYDIEINPDFLAKKDTGELHVILAVRPIRLITPFIGYLNKVSKKSISFVKSYKKTKKEKSTKAKNKVDKKTDTVKTVEAAQTADTVNLANA